MSILSDFEDRVGRAVEGMFAGVFRSPVQPAELAKALAKQMDRERSVGVGKVYGPTLFTVLISPADEEKLGAFADTLSGELSTYLVGYARERTYELSSRPLVRFLVDEKLKLGRFEAYAELASPEELARVATEMHASTTPVARDVFEPADAGVADGPARPSGGLSPEPDRADRPAEPLLYDQHEDDLDFSEFVPSEAGGPVAPSGPAVVDVAIPAAPHPAAQITTVLSATPSASLATVTVTGIEHDVVLRGERMVVGRLADCDVALQDANSSREHAAFVSVPGGWAIEDLGSTNGTWINGAPVRQRIKLRDGDTVTVGVTELVFHGPEA